MVCDANAFKKGVQPLVFPIPINLHGNNLAIKETFNMSLKEIKFLKDIGFIFEQIYPAKLAKIINKTDIVFLPSYRNGSGPQTSEKTSSKGALDSLTERG